MSDSAAKLLNKLHPGTPALSDAHGGLPEFTKAEIAQAAGRVHDAIGYPLVMLLHAGCDAMRPLLITRLAIKIWGDWFETMGEGDAITPKLPARMSELLVAEMESYQFRQQLTQQYQAHHCGVSVVTWRKKYEPTYARQLSHLGSLNSSCLRTVQRALKDRMQT